MIASMGMMLDTMKTKPVERMLVNVAAHTGNLQTAAVR